MECEADGYPDPKISWARQDGKLLPSGQETLVSGKLTIPNVQRNNRGEQNESRWIKKVMNV